ncbi:hypothetical protein ACIG47_09135 [Promicromonospora sp. NPDC052451]|uniref:hypothetical protein n=1 Tax=Promicromonospora sp. NPDC052451 TaxID=3364407 RepID=UPI0037C524E2
MAEVINALLSAGLRDWVMLDEVTWEVMEGDLSAENQAKTLAVLGRLYADGLMVPGDLTARGFEDWVGGPAEWLIRSERELVLFGWKPMGAGFYLRLTELGKRRAREAQDE